MLVGLCAVALAATSLASGATTKHCGTLYTPKCKKPVITTRHLPGRCDAPTKTFTLPAIHDYAIAGLRKVEVTLGSKVLFEKTFKGTGTQSYTIRHLKVHTASLASGGHTLKIKATDVNGRTTTRTERFTVCPRPRFTG